MSNGLAHTKGTSNLSNSDSSGLVEMEIGTDSGTEQTRSKEMEVMNRFQRWK